MSEDELIAWYDEHVAGPFAGTGAGTSAEWGPLGYIFYCGKNEQARIIMQQWRENVEKRRRGLIHEAAEMVS